MLLLVLWGSGDPGWRGAWGPALAPPLTTTASCWCTHRVTWRGRCCCHALRGGFRTFRPRMWLERERAAAIAPTRHRCHVPWRGMCCTHAQRSMRTGSGCAGTPAEAAGARLVAGRWLSFRCGCPPSGAARRMAGGPEGQRGAAPSARLAPRAQRSRGRSCCCACGARRGAAAPGRVSQVSLPPPSRLPLPRGPLTARADCDCRTPTDYDTDGSCQGAPAPTRSPPPVSARPPQVETARKTATMNIESASNMETFQVCEACSPGASHARRHVSRAQPRGASRPIHTARQ